MAVLAKRLRRRAIVLAVAHLDMLDKTATVFVERIRPFGVESIVGESRGRVKSRVLARAD